MSALEGSLEASIVARAPIGVSEHDAPGAWRVIVARSERGARVWYHGRNDDPRHVEITRQAARDWYARSLERQARSLEATGRPELESEAHALYQRAIGVRQGVCS